MSTTDMHQTASAMEAYWTRKEPPVIDPEHERLAELHERMREIRDDLDIPRKHRVTAHMALAEMDRRGVWSELSEARR